MGDLGGYGIAELPPAGPLFARGPYRALGQKGNPWEVVRNSISAHVTHAEITHFFLKKSCLWGKNLILHFNFKSIKEYYCYYLLFCNKINRKFYYNNNFNVYL